jgi:hypothetical protein
MRISYFTAVLQLFPMNYWNMSKNTQIIVTKLLECSEHKNY